MAGVRLEKLVKRFGRTQVIQGIDLEIADGEMTVFVGPSGCGKSTLLRLVAGLESATSGRILIGGRDVTHVAPAKRGVSMVFQSYALYPHMNVYRNIAFGLKLAGASKADIDARVRRTAEMLQIGQLLERLPRELSGGQRQRVAIGRAIVREPDVFLFDEPLSNLDAALRARTRLEIAKMHEDLGATMIYVTHDQLEAMTLADRIVLLNAGRIEQAGAPSELYDSPATRFVAEFMGSPTMNLIPVTIENGTALLPTGECLPALPANHNGPAALGVRAENIRCVGPDQPDTLAAQVERVEELGDARLIHAVLADGTAMIVRQNVDDPRPQPREAVHLQPGLNRLHFFASDGTRLR